MHTVKLQILLWHPRHADVLATVGRTLTNALSQEP